MANHGYCKNCWWYQMILGDAYKFVDHPMFGHILVKDVYEHGNCYMQNDKEGHPYKEVKSIDYCPDYINRKKEIKHGGKTLEEWIEQTYGK